MRTGHKLKRVHQLSTTLEIISIFIILAMKIFHLVFALCLLRSVSTSHLKYHAIFNFGDSLSDTGNFLVSGALAFPVIGKLPYGETFFRHATGRCSDGRLVIDFMGTLIYPSSSRL